MHKFDNFDEMDQLLEKYKTTTAQPIWNNLNSPITIKEIEFMVINHGLKIT